MIALAWTALCFLGMFLFAALGDLVSEEVRGWLDLAPRAILRLAATRLDPELRETIYQDAWLPDLFYFLRGDESRPITRVIRGTTFALGILISARKIEAALSAICTKTGTMAAAGVVTAAAEATPASADVTYYQVKYTGPDAVSNLRLRLGNRVPPDIDFKIIQAHDHPPTPH